MKNQLLLATGSLLFAIALSACHSSTRRAGEPADLSRKDTRATAAAKPGSIPASRLIVPGKSIGETHIGEPMDSVLRSLGKPDAGDAAMGKSLSFWYAGHNPSGYQTGIFASRDMGNDAGAVARVEQIWVTSPYFTTADGLHTGVYYRTIANLHPLRRTATLGFNLYVCKTTNGMSFEFDADSLCTGIYVQSPGFKGGISYAAYHDHKP